MEKKIFKSKYTLRFQDEQIANKYYEQKKKSIQNKNTIFTCIVFGFSLLSLIIHVTNFHLHPNNLQYRVNKYFTIISFSFHLISLMASIFLKKRTKVQIAINFVNYCLVTFDFSFIRYLSKISSLGIFYEFVSNLTYFLEMTWRFCFYLMNMVTFVECLLLNILIMVSYCIFYVPLIILEKDSMSVGAFITMNVVICFFQYILAREKKIIFYYHQLSDRQNVWYQNTFEYMNKGMLKLRNSKIVYANKTMRETFRNLKIVSEDDSTNTPWEAKQEYYDTNSDSIITKLLINQTTDRLNTGLNDTITYLDIQNQGEQLKNYLKFLASEFKLFSNCINNNNFKPLGIKKYIVENNKSELTYNKSIRPIEIDVFYRYWIDDDNSECFELICDDVTKIKLIEERNAMIKYKTMIFSKVVHEFKNPLITINELMNSCLDKLTGKYLHEQQYLYDNLHASKGLIDYLQILVKDIDYILNHQLGSEEKITKDEVNIEEISNFCKNVSCGLIRKLNKQEKVEFCVEMKRKREMILITDEIKLKQILVNLISNSIKFTNSGKITLSIEQLDQKIVLSIEDTGIGMKEQYKQELIQQMFTPYVKNIDENNKIGNGLGLFIIKSLAEKLGTGFSLMSEENKGTKTSFELPITNNTINKEEFNLEIIQSPTLTDESKSSRQNDSLLNEGDATLIMENLVHTIPLTYRPTPQVNTTLNNLTVHHPTVTDSVLFAIPKHNKTLNIIVVDDELLIRQSTLRLILKTAANMNMTVNIIEATDGIETLYKVFENISTGREIHCVISDETMTYINGIQSAEIIGNLCNKAGMRKILFYIVSAYEFKRDRNDIIQSFESKPINVNIIKKILTQCRETFTS